MVALILTDFSDAAENAARYGADLSQQVPLEKVILYHSIETSRAATELPLPSESVRRDRIENSTRKLEHLKNVLTPRLPAGVSVELVTDDRPLEQSVRALASEKMADLVIIGTAHKGRLEKVLYESTTSLLAASCASPLLIIPENLKYVPVKTVVFTSDLRKVSVETPFQTIKEFIESLQARLLVLNVYKEDAGPEPDQIMSEQAELHRQLDDKHAEFHYVQGKDIVQGILDFLGEHDAQMVITIPKEHSFLHSIFHPSITKHLASESRIPLLLLHPDRS